MSKTRFLILLLAALVALGAVAGCGGDDEVPDEAIAVVGGREIMRAQFDDVMAQAKRSYKLQSTPQNPRPFPKAGTPEYNTLKNQAVQYLVQRAMFEEKAEDLDIEITDAEVDKRVQQIKQQYFQGNEKRWQQQIKQTGLTEAQVRNDVRAQLIQEELFKKVTEDVKVSDKDIADYYKKNQNLYGQPASRDIRHILVPSKSQADDIHAQLQDGGNFAALAKKFSKDPGSKDQGGKLTVARGQTVPPFDRVAFKLAVGELSQPVKTQYGYHIIEALSAIKPAKTTPIAKVRSAIRQQLLQTKKNEKMTKWVEDTKKDFESETSYQVGFKPPKQTTTTSTQDDDDDD